LRMGAGRTADQIPRPQSAQPIDARIERMAPRRRGLGFGCRQKAERMRRQPLRQAQSRTRSRQQHDQPQPEGRACRDKPFYASSRALLACELPPRPAPLQRHRRIVRSRPFGGGGGSPIASRPGRPLRLGAAYLNKPEACLTCFSKKNGDGRKGAAEGVRKPRGGVVLNISEISQSSGYEILDNAPLKR